MRGGSPNIFCLGLCLITLFLGACGGKNGPAATPAKEQEEAGGHHDHGEESSGAEFQEGKGIILAQETAQSIGLQLAEVEEKSFDGRTLLPAQVYREANEVSRRQGLEKKGNAYATALLPAESARALKEGQVVLWKSAGGKTAEGKGRLARIEDSQADVLGKAELLFELTGAPENLLVGDNVAVEILAQGPVRKSAGIPAGAVLKTATGTFAFVKNGDFLLRTEIKTGRESGGAVEVLEGLYEGDVVAAAPAETLYLIELRAVKGGGHCH